MQIQAEDLEVTLAGYDRPHHFPWVYLRDCCTCEKCYHPVSKARLSLMKNLDVNIKPQTVEVEAETGNVNIHKDDIKVCTCNNLILNPGACDLARWTQKLILSLLAGGKNPG